MAYPTIILPLMKVQGMAIFPFILLKDHAGKNDEKLIRHETIHLRQQLEMLVLPFYLLYIILYMINRLKYDHHKAYLNIVFEREAYAEEGNVNYLKKRKLWSWVHY